MKLVVDGSVALQLCLADAGFDLVRDHELVAPPLLRSEVLSSLRASVWRRDVSAALAARALERLPSMPITLERPDDLDRQAWDIAAQLGWAKIYDAEYVALARTLECPLLTVDARLRRGAESLVTVLAPIDL